MVFELCVLLGDIGSATRLPNVSHLERAGGGLRRMTLQWRKGVGARSGRGVWDGLVLFELCVANPAV